MLNRILYSSGAGGGGGAAAAGMAAANPAATAAPMSNGDKALDYLGKNLPGAMSNFGGGKSPALAAQPEIPEFKLSVNPMEPNANPFGSMDIFNRRKRSQNQQRG